MKRRFKIGIQQYSVRDATADDFAGTLGALAEMGYQGIEFFDFYKHSPESVASETRKAGLIPAGIYGGEARPFINPAHPPYAFFQALDCHALTFSCGRVVASQWSTSIDSVVKAADTAWKKGITCQYHNHAHEFDRLDGDMGLDLMLTRTDPVKVKLELDTGFALEKHQDPGGWLDRYSGRVMSLHLKDIDMKAKHVVELGCGSLDIPAVLQAAEQAGVEWLIVEFCDIKHIPAMGCAKLCCDYLKQLGI